MENEKWKMKNAVAPPPSSPALRLCRNCHSEEPFGHAQDKFRDEESAFGL
ncbi:MAG: hypothetical protein ACREXY_17795 [Gammaproteobacteria bacterium]